MSSDFLHWEDGGIFVTYRTTITFACPIRSWWDFTKCFWIMSEHGIYWTDRNKRSNLGWFQRDRLFLPIPFTLPLLHPSSLAALGYRQWRFWSCELEWYFLVPHNVVFCSRAGQTQCLGPSSLGSSSGQLGQVMGFWVGAGKSWFLENVWGLVVLGSFCWATWYLNSELVLGISFACLNAWMYFELEYLF